MSPSSPFTFTLDMGVSHPGTVAKEREVLRDLVCPSCGVSDWTTDTQALVPGPADEIEFQAGGCHRVITVRFELRGPGLLDLLRDRSAGRLEGEAEDETR